VADSRVEQPFEAGPRPMMGLLAVGVVAFGAALLTLFSGFGLGTLLLPVFAVFLPLELAVAGTAVVHLANNLFKVGLVGRHADRSVVVAFGIPAAIAALAGAWLLAGMTELPVLGSYVLGPIRAEVSLTKLVIGVSIIVFALFDLVPSLRDLEVDRRWLSLGGALSGFFGGISGHQGALRSMFLVRCGLDRDAFVGTGVLAAVLVDFSRLAVYGASFFGRHVDTLGAGGERVAWLVAVATGAAFAGSFAGSRLLRKVTLGFVQNLVGLSIIVLGLALAAGWI
jgi:uncharacterized membrane protein YfcA